MLDGQHIFARLDSMVDRNVVLGATRRREASFDVVDVFHATSMTVSDQICSVFFWHPYVLETIYNFDCRIEQYTVSQ